MITVRERSKDMKIIREANPDSRKYNWLEWNPEQQRGVFLQYPERDQIPETIKEQLIVELYSK